MKETRWQVNVDISRFRFKSKIDRILDFLFLGLLRDAFRNGWIRGHESARIELEYMLERKEIKSIKDLKVWLFR